MLARATHHAHRSSPAQGVTKCLRPRDHRRSPHAAACVEVTSVRYNGTIHDFMILNPVAETPATRAAVAEACQYLRAVFARGD